MDRCDTLKCPSIVHVGYFQHPMPVYWATMNSYVQSTSSKSVSAILQTCKPNILTIWCYVNKQHPVVGRELINRSLTVCILSPPCHNGVPTCNHDVFASLVRSYQYFLRKLRTYKNFLQVLALLSLLYRRYNFIFHLLHLFNYNKGAYIYLYNFQAPDSSHTHHTIH